MDTSLMEETFKKAYDRRNQPKNLIFHSDRGSQYTSKTFRRLLDEMDVIQSFSTKGHPYDSAEADSYDNAVAESIFKFLKLEEINRRTYYTKKELEDSLLEYIEGFYNSKRPHSANNMLSPNQKEKQYTESLNK